MKKIIFSVTLIIVLAFAFSLNFTFAKNDKNADIPEEDGTYDVPGHPELKVRVFVHKVKPGPAPTPPLQCNLSDPTTSSDVAWAGWYLPDGFIYKLNPSSVPSTVNGDLSIIAEKAFAQFEGHTGGVNAVFGGTTTINTKGYDGENIIAWGRASGSALGVTYIWYNTITKEATQIDTIMNQRYSWYWSQQTNCAYSGVYDAQNILTHEIGHWFGLNDHYTAGYVNATMYGYGSKTEVKKNTLTNGDINGLKTIY